MRPKGILLLEAAAVALFSALLGWLVLRLGRSGAAWSDVPGLFLAAVAGYALADVASGLAHWFCDTFFAEDTPWIGPVLISPFREHHRDPLAMTRHGFLELTGNSCLGIAPVLGVVVGRPGSAVLDAAAIAFALGLFATNLFHRWAHATSVPRGVECLQKWNLILNPARHGVHHLPPHKGAYCVTSGWLNVLLDRILP